MTGGATLSLQGDGSQGTESVLSGDVETLDGPDGPGLLEIAEDANLLVLDESVSARIRGPLRNVGAIFVLAGELVVFGTGTGLEADGLSTGIFLGPGDSDGHLWLDGVNFGDGAGVGYATLTSTRLAEGVDMFAVDTTIRSVDDTIPALAGAGSVELYEDSVVDGPIEGSVDLVVPEEETASVGEATLSDTVRMDVEGELRQPVGSELVLEDDATMHVSGVHRLVGADADRIGDRGRGTRWSGPGHRH